MSVSSNPFTPRRWLPWTSLLVVLLVILGIVATSPIWRSQAIAQQASPQQTSPQQAFVQQGTAQAPAINGAPQRHAEGLSTAFRQASEVATPPVVRIEAHAKAKAVRRGRPETRPFPGGENPFKGTPFEDLFKDEQFEFRFEDPRRSRGKGPARASSSIAPA